METLVKTMIFVLLIGIIISLGSGLFWLVKDKDGNSKKMVNSLTVRISLSVALFVLLIVAYQMGILQPHSAIPSAPAQ